MCLLTGRESGWVPAITPISLVRSQSLREPSRGPRPGPASCPPCLQAPSDPWPLKGQELCLLSPPPETLPCFSGRSFDNLLSMWWVGTWTHPSHSRGVWRLNSDSGTGRACSADPGGKGSFLNSPAGRAFPTVPGGSRVLSAVK